MSKTNRSKEIKVTKIAFFATDPPSNIAIVQETNMYDVHEVSFLTTVSCNISAANPQCNISWDHPNLYLSGDQEITGNKTDGFYTNADITLNVSRSSGDQNVTCTAQCGEFDKISKSLNLKIPICYRTKGNSETCRYLKKFVGNAIFFLVLIKQIAILIS